jgi:tetratricopeptide (TPR) repeat protein/transcriptional regulator with XRE-family HTH domain
MSFGERLRQERLRRQLTQEALAGFLNISPRTINRWEQNLAVPRFHARQQLSRFFGVKPNVFFQDLESRLSPPPLLTVPFSRNPCFTGRETLLRTLHIQLAARQLAGFMPSVALSGLGGIGKTQVAIEYAYRYAQEYRAIFWLAAETPESMMVSLQAIAERLRLPGYQATEQGQMVQGVRQWLATHPQWLLIADNVEDPALLQMVLPTVGTGSLLLTTRRQALGTLARPLQVPPMNDEEGCALLLRRARLLNDSTSTISPSEILKMPVATGTLELVEMLEGLPLALDQVGAYLEETGCSVAEYLKRYCHQRERMLARRGLYGGTHSASVSTTLQLSIEQATRQYPAALDLLRLCSFFHSEAIPEELLRAESSPLGPASGSIADDVYQLDSMLAALRGASLVIRSPETGTISVHRLVQAVLQDQMEPAEGRLWSQRAIRLINEAFPKESFDTWERCERYLAHALACLSLINQKGEDPPPEAGELSLKTGSYLLARGRYEEAKPLLEQAILLGEHQSGFDHVQMIPQREKRAELFWRQGQYEPAEELLQQVLSLAEQHLGPDHSQTAETLNNLAVLYWSQNKYEEAEPLIQRALRIREHQLGPDHLETATSCANLALLYWSQGRYQEARPMYERALRIQEQLLGPDHPEVAGTLNNLATVYRDQEQYEESQRLYERALRIREQCLGPDHPHTALSLGNLARVYRDQGQYEKAEPLFQHALALSEQRLGATHRQTRIIRDNYNRLLEQKKMQ